MQQYEEGLSDVKSDIGDRLAGCRRFTVFVMREELPSDLQVGGPGAADGPQQKKNGGGSGGWKPIEAMVVSSRPTSQFTAQQTELWCVGSELQPASQP